MLRLVPLLARRAAELPRYRVRAQSRYTPGYGADLELEPDAWRTGRAGDLAYDLEPDEVPRDERAPEAGFAVRASDLAARAYIRAAIVTAITQGAPEDAATEARLIHFQARLDAPGRHDLDAEVAELTEHLDYMGQAPDEHGIGLGAMAALQEPLSELAALGFRSPLEMLEMDQ